MPKSSHKRKSMKKKSLTSKVTALAKKVRIMRPELKSYFTERLTVNMNPTGQTLNLFPIAEGVTSSTRVGLFIQPIGYWADYQVLHNPSAGNTVARFWIVRDKQQVADSAPVFSTVAYNTAYPATTGLSDSSAKRFDVLYSATHCLSSQRPIIAGKIRLSLKNGPQIKFNGTTSGDLQKNNIYMIYWSDQISYPAQLSMSDRATYVDP